MLAGVFIASGFVKTLMGEDDRAGAAWVDSAKSCQEAIVIVGG